MKLKDFPEHIQKHLIPEVTGQVVYRCLDCGTEYDIDRLLYTCPACHSVLLLADLAFDRVKKIDSKTWHQIFDYRKMLNIAALKGIYRYHEFIGPMMPLDAVICLGEGHTPMVEANAYLQDLVGARFYFKNEGQNPSASFKDRGMAAALSYLNFIIRTQQLDGVLAICASTGDTSAAAALYAAYLGQKVASAVLLPHGKVTPQQLSQPLGAGARVLEIPGVFDDCMRVVEALSEHYHVALLNSKNSWRIRGQESYAYEVAQWFDYDLSGKVIVVPIGNAGNITAVLEGLLRFHDLGIIEALPKVIGVQSRHANPVFRYYQEKNPQRRLFVPVTVQPSVAQAAMIGRPVSMPRVIRLVEEYSRRAGDDSFAVVEVTEQEIMDNMLLANRNGHIACTQGGESLAGLRAALRAGIVNKDEVAVVDATAHHLKFIGFQQMYFDNSFPPEFEVTPKPEYQNRPQLLAPEKMPVHSPWTPAEMQEFTQDMVQQVAAALGLKTKG